MRDDDTTPHDDETLPRDGADTDEPKADRPGGPGQSAMRPAGPGDLTPGAPQEAPEPDQATEDRRDRLREKGQDG